MKFTYILFSILILLSGCEKFKKKPEGCDRDSRLLSELKTRTDHYLPFALCNDVDDEIENIRINDKIADLDFGYQLEFRKSGFFELIKQYKNITEDNDTILFTLVTEEREHAEWGIEAWTPGQFITDPLPACQLLSIYPRQYVEGMGIPFIFYTLLNGTRLEGYYSGSSSTTGEEFFLKHGVGSLMLKAEGANELQSFSFGDETISLSISKSGDTPQSLSGEITEDLIIPQNSIVRITGDLTISGTASLVINAGTVILVDEAVNIYNSGPITINGEEGNPVLITCTHKDKYWGGFISEGENSIIHAGYTIFCQSGYHHTGEYANWGHAQRQALFYTHNSELDMSHCYMIDHAGQIFYPRSSRLNLESILVQRVKTSGQLNYTHATIANSIFTDFPDDSQIYRDEDNDALYINASDVTIDNCLFMFAKDDGMDSGGDEGGTVTVTNTRFEACFHEGAALSSKNDVVKHHIFENCTFYNCGQGLELGFSSPNHIVTADNCMFINNYIGIRFGDNYESSLVYGQMDIRNSQSLYNGKDVWNMVRKIWAPRLQNMHFENVQVSSFVKQYPELEVIGN